MPDVTRCPTRDELRRFLLGDVDDEEAARVQGHLSTCCSCLETLPRLETNDVRLQAMQTQGRLAVDPGLASTTDSAFSPTFDQAVEPGNRRGRFSIVRPHAQGGLGQVSIARDE